MLSNNQDAHKLIDILVGGNNFYNTNGERLTKLAIITGNVMINEYISFDLGVLFAAGFIVLTLVIMETSFYIKSSRMKRN